MRSSQMRPGLQMRTVRVAGCTICLARKARGAELDVLVLDLAVVKELEGWPVVVDLPDQVGQGDKIRSRDADGGPAVEEEAALWCKEEAESGVRGGRRSSTVC